MIIGAAARQHVDETVRVWLGLPRPRAPVPQLPEKLARQLLRCRGVRAEHIATSGGAGEQQLRPGVSARGVSGSRTLDRWVARAAAGARRIDRAPSRSDRRARPSRSASPTTSTSSAAARRRREAPALDADLPLARPPGGSTPRPPRPARAAGCSRGPGGQRRRLDRTRRPTRSSSAVAIEQELGVRASYFFTIYPGAASSPGTTASTSSRIRVSSEGSGNGFADVLSHPRSKRASTSGSTAATTPLFRDEMLAGEKPGARAAHGTGRHDDEATLPALGRPHDAAPAGGGRPERGLNASASTETSASGRVPRLPFHHFDLERGTPPEPPRGAARLFNDGAAAPAATGSSSTLGLARARPLHRLIDTVAEVGGVATILFHPNSLERPEFSPALSRLDRLRPRARSAGSHRCATSTAWWREREARLGAT